ncbi:D-glycero-beta-D-manno-heptose 1-phosphate adenylyltransferase, partial [Hyphomonas oceanitis]
EAREVYDVSGAGDTSIAALALGLAAGGTLEEAVALAIAASGIAVGKSGTATVAAVELSQALQMGMRNGGVSHVPLETLKDQVEVWRDAQLTVGFTNGCFDILHPGHLRVLEEAKARCGRLIVGLNSDASVKRLKGPTRPVNDEVSRARVLSGLTAVDAVVVFDEDTPRELIEALQPDLLVKGGDYSIETIVGADTVLARGGTVHIVPLVDGQSTTAAIARANAQAE